MRDSAEKMTQGSVQGEDRSREKDKVRVLLTPAQASERYQVSPAYWYGRGKSRSGLPGVIRIGRHIRIDPEIFETGKLDGHEVRPAERTREAVSSEKVLSPGNYRCQRCGWVGYVSKSVLPEDLCCPQCGVRAQVEQVVS